MATVGRQSAGMRSAGGGHMRIGRVRVYARAVPARTCEGYRHTATKAEFPLVVPALQRH